MTRRSRWRRGTPAHRVEGLAAEQVAVGSLTGVPPSDIRGHVVLVTRKDGSLAVSSSMCPEMTNMLLADVLAAGMRQVYATHVHGRPRDDG